MEICNVLGCTRLAVTNVAGWPDKKVLVHRHFHEKPCSFCESKNHCRVDCKSLKLHEVKLRKIFGGN